jgi:hypothetical protein
VTSLTSPLPSLFQADLKNIGGLESLSPDLLERSKKQGFADKQIAALIKRWGYFLPFPFTFSLLRSN